MFLTRKFGKIYLQGLRMNDNHPVINFIKGKGPYLWTKDGQKFIDTAAGTFNLSLGYQNQEVNLAVKKQIDQLIHCSSAYHNDIVSELHEKLIKVSPKNLEFAHTKVCSGSTAIEGAVKLAQYYTKKSGIICFQRSHHGQTALTLSMSGFSFRKEDFYFSSDNIYHTPYPYYSDEKNKTTKEIDLECIKNIEDIIKFNSKNNVGALIIEPILGNGGNITPSSNFLRSLKRLCEKNNIVLIFDEIQTGIGRTGYMFASQYFKVEPNILVTAKGLGSGYPVAAILMEKKFTSMPKIHHSFTYGSHLSSCAAANKVLDIINNKTFLENVQKNGKYLKNRLTEIQAKYEFIFDVRGTGLMLGVEIRASNDMDLNTELTNKIVKIAEKNKLLLRTSEYGRGNVIKFRPCLNIEKKQIDEILNIFNYSLSTVCKIRR